MFASRATEPVKLTPKSCIHLILTEFRLAPGMNRECSLDQRQMQEEITEWANWLKLVHSCQKKDAMSSRDRGVITAAMSNCFPLNWHTLHISWLTKQKMQSEMGDSRGQLVYDWNTPSWQRLLWEGGFM